MLVSLIAIGNSKGIRLPKTVLEECDISDKLQLEVNNDIIILRPVKDNPRSGWEEAFLEMHKNGDDSLVLPDSINSENFSWEW